MHNHLLVLGPEHGFRRPWFLKLLFSLSGGNAKTLMFVNISPADYNTDETVTSLT